MSAPASYDTHGRRITSSDLSAAMRINIVAGALGTIWFGMTLSMPLTMFMEAIGASGVLIGMITTFRLLTMLVQIPSAVISENLGARKRMWAPVAIIHRCFWFGVALLAAIWSPEARWIAPAVVIVVAASDLLGQCGAAPWFSWMTDLIPVKTSGRFWGIRQTVVTAASLVGVALAGYLLDAGRNPSAPGRSTGSFAVVFAIGAVLGVADIVVHLWVKEPRPQPVDRGESLWVRVMAPLKLPEFRRFTLSLGIWSFGTAMVGTFGNVYLKREFPVSYSHLAGLAIAGSLGSVATSYLFGHLIDRLGARIFGAMVFILAPLTGVVWFFISPSWVSIGPFWIPQAVLLLGVGSFVAGSLFSAVALCQMRLLGILAPGAGRTMAMAVHWSLIGLLASLGPLLGGVIMDRFTQPIPHWILSSGVGFSFLHLQILIMLVAVWAGALPLWIKIRTPEVELPFGTAVSRLVLLNPLQAVRNLYNLHIISAQTTRHRRAQAVRKLGASRSGLAVPDLASKLDDPSIDVQEEAIEALGSIATHDAVDALMEKLRDPGSELTPRIARALRLAGDPRAVDSLLPFLQSPDRETLAETARALGAVGERKAIPPLLDLIRHTRDNKVLAAASEALAALGEVSAVYQIIPQLRSVPNRTLKRALAVAVGDLLGERESFYRLLIAESEAHGAGASQVLRDLSRSIRRRFPSAHAQLQATEELESAYHGLEIASAAGILLHLGLHLIQFIHRVPISLDPAAAMQNLLDRDRRAALGVWYLKILSEPWEQADGTDSRSPQDILLGLHIIAGIMADTEPPAPPSDQGAERLEAESFGSE